MDLKTKEFDKLRPFLDLKIEKRSLKKVLRQNLDQKDIKIQKNYFFGPNFGLIWILIQRNWTNFDLNNQNLTNFDLFKT